MLISQYKKRIVLLNKGVFVILLKININNGGFRNHFLNLRKCLGHLLSILVNPFNCHFHKKKKNIIINKR